MAKFQYTVRTKEGKLKSDFIEAASPEAAISVLQSQQLIITDLKPVEEVKKLTLTRLNDLVSFYFSRIKTEEIVLFTRQLAALIQAKVPLVQSLRVLSKQVKNPRFSEIIVGIADDVDTGMVFSRSLARYPKIFSNFYIQMIRSGEISGRLEEVLNYLSNYINRQYLLNSKAKGAMIYPAFIVAAFIIIAVLMLIFVIPNLTSILSESGQKLPFVTRALIGAADFMKSWGWILFIFLAIGIYVASIFAKKSPEWRYILDNLKLHLPIFGGLLKKIYLTRFAETFSTLSSAGIAVSQSLEITADVVGNSIYRKIILEANEAVRKGSNISVVFDRHPEILPMVTQMIAIGEQTGRLDTILKQVAVFFTDDVNRAFDNIVNLIEPILIVSLGAGVAFLVAAILLPIYNLVNAF